MTSNDSSELVAKPTAFFWATLEQYADDAQQRLGHFSRCIVAARAKVDGALKVDSSVFEFYVECQKLFTDGLRLSNTLSTEQGEIDAWLQKVGKKHDVARERYTVKDLDWSCLLWQFAPDMIGVPIPNKTSLKEALNVTLDQIALGRTLVIRATYLARYHVEVDVTVFCGIAEDGSTLDEGAQFTRALNLYCFV